MRFGIATREIVPPFKTQMRGYGVRWDYFDDVNDPLTFTAVVLEEGRRRAMIGAADLCAFSNETTSALLDRAAEAAGCPRDNVMLNASHTHGGPAVPTRSYMPGAQRDPAAAERYGEWLGERVVAAAGEAVENMMEGTLWYGEGNTALPMNRRPDRDGQVPNAPNPGGPTDDRIQLLVLRDAAGDVAAVGMRVACHPVATGAQHLLTADYPGAWRAEFARAFGPKVTPFFLQGAGADARPGVVADGDHWRTMKHAELPVIGRALLAECLDILTSAKLKEIRDLTLQGKINTVAAPCEKRCTEREHFETLLKQGDSTERIYAEECLRRLDAGEGIPDHAVYQVQTLWLNADLALIGLDVEPLCGLGSKVESAVAPRQAVLLGYTNGCVSYAPDTHELRRGGYETGSYLYQPWTGPLLPGLEDLFADAVVRGAGSRS